MMSEVASRLETAEGEVEKVAAVAAADAEPSPEEVERLEKVGGVAEMKLSTTAKLIDVKLKTAQGFLKEELQAMHDKIGAAEKKLSGVMKSTAEKRDQLLCAEILAGAGQHVRKALLRSVTNCCVLRFLQGP